VTDQVRMSRSRGSPPDCRRRGDRDHLLRGERDRDRKERDDLDLDLDLLFTLVRGDREREDLKDRDLDR